MPNIFFHTFGCKVNQYETETLRSRLLRLGYQVAHRMEDSDVCVVNSCSVTEEADKKCRQYLRRILRTNPTARVLVTGCYATRMPQELKDISPRIEVYSNQDKESLPQIVSGCSLSTDESPLLTFFHGHTRAFVKVQDGCDATCTYCIIPKVRPQMRSRPIEEIVQEVKGLLGQGYKEIVLTGIRLGSYGLQSSGGRVGKVHGNLCNLLQELLILPGFFRIRLSSLEITEVGEDLIRLAERSEKICRHLHLPLQSGDDFILKRMGRWYSSQFFSETVEKIRKNLPDICITSDVIVGFPGETEGHFKNTYDFIERFLNGLHVFPFSDRQGTSAVQLPGHLSPKTIKDRVKNLLDLDRRLRKDFQNSFNGQKRQVLAETDGGFTDNGIRIPPPLPIPEGTLDWVLVPEWRSPLAIPV